MKLLFLDRKILSWALYDWANSAFATTVVAGFFPVLYSHLTSELSTRDSQFWFNITIAVGSIIIGFASPLMGSIADHVGQRKKFLSGFAFLGILMCLGLAWVAAGPWWMALIVYGIGQIGFNGANTFYDSLIMEVSPSGDIDLISAFGYAMGYIGGGILFLINVIMVTHPDWFGFESVAAALVASFISVGIWWLVFTMPLLFFVKEPDRQSEHGVTRSVIQGLKSLRSTLGEIRQLRTATLFLVGYWLYIDGVGTIYKMAVFFADRVLGLPSESLIQALLLTQFIAFPASLVFGAIGRRVGPKFGILIGLSVYVLAVGYAWGWLETSRDFYFLAVAIGLVQGGVQSLSRSLFTRLIPVAKTAEFFGFFNLVGRFSSILGPLLIAYIPYVIVGVDERDSILVLIAIFVAGGIMLYRLDINEGIREAQEMQARLDA